MSTLRIPALASALVIALVTLAGCEGARIPAKGKVLANGNPLKLSDKGVLTVTFYAEDDKEATNPFPTIVDQKEGTFTVSGKEQRGLPPGKYRIAVTAVDPYPSGKDLFNDKYKGKNTDIVKDVKDTSEIVLDLKK